MTNSSDKQQLSTVEIRPEVTMLSVLQHLNYKAWFAMAEFIDNALQSSLANHEQLNALHGGRFQLDVRIKIDLSGTGQIVITDNAAGISEGDFPRAFRAAQVPLDRTGLSEFGMGMKSAACWFAEAWSVRTTAIGESVERTIHFDIANIVENKIESLKTQSRDVAPHAHYTVITLRKLHHLPKGRTVGKIRDHLASIYRVFLRDGRLVLRLNDEQLRYESPNVLKAVSYASPGVPVQTGEMLEWIKPIDLDFGGGQRVKGFAALREVGSTPLAGFALFRRDRLIEGSFDETYRPSYIFKHTNSYPYQRLFGELHVEGFDVSHTKDGFRWEEFEDIFLEHLKDEIRRGALDLLTQAENYRALPSRRSIGDDAEGATAAVARHVKERIAPLLVEAIKNPIEVSELPSELENRELRSSEHIVELDDGDHRWLIVLRTSVDPSVQDWVSVAKMEATVDSDEDVRRLMIDLSLSHPFSCEFLGHSNENIELLLRVATMTCIALVLAEDISGEPPESFLYHFNYLLRGSWPFSSTEGNG